MIDFYYVYCIDDKDLQEITKTEVPDFSLSDFY